MDPASNDTAAATTPAPAAPKGTKVGKAFNTHNRRFKVGDAVTAQDLEGSALDFETMKSRKFIVTA